MKHYLISKGYFNIVDGSEEKPEDSAAENAKQAFKKRSEQAFSILVLAVSSEMIYLISE